MQQEKAESVIDHLYPAECVQVLHELLERHEELREEANEVAKSVIGDVTVEVVAKEVASRARSVGIAQLSERAGKHFSGYVDPYQAASDLLEESIENIRAEMKRRAKSGMNRDAEKICQGLVIGLHEVDGTNNDGALGWAPEFPREAAGWSLSLLLELYPPGERRLAGARVIREVEVKAHDWVPMLEWVVSRSVAEK